MKFFSLSTLSLSLFAPYAVASDNNIEKIQVYGLSFADEGVQAKSKNDLEQTMATTIDELFSDVANLEAIQGPGRQFYDLNLRGSEGAGSVIVTVDGAEKNLVTTKHGTSFNPVFLAPEFLKAVTVIRGPVSNTFGTGSTGGRVQFETIDPFDYVDGSDVFGGELRVNGESNGDGRLFSGVVAHALNDDVAFLGAISQREFESYKDGDGQEVLNSGSESTNYLGKVQWTTQSGVDLEFTHARSDIEYIGSNVFGRNNNRQDADFANDVTDSNTSLLIDYIDASGFTWQTDVFLSTTDHTETLLAAREGANGEIGTTERRDVTTQGFKSFISQRTGLGGVEMDVSLGVSGSANELEYIEASSDIGGESQNAGIFAQARVQLTDVWSIVPGLRYETFDLKTELGTATSGSAWTPKFTTNYRLAKGVTLYGSIARGIRAPSLNNLVLGSTSERVRGRNTTITTQLPTEQLDYEMADTFDLGLRVNRVVGEDSRIKGNITLFRNDVSDRIESLVLSREVDGRTTRITTQYQNVGDSVIEGIEVDISYHWGNMSSGMTYSRSQGERKDTGEELNSVRPEMGNVFVQWSGLDDKLVLRADVESFGSKTEIGESDIIGASSDAATIANLFAGYALNDKTVVKARVNNVTDKQYRRFDQIDNAMGRNVRVELVYRF